MMNAYAPTALPLTHQVRGQTPEVMAKILAYFGLS